MPAILPEVTPIEAYLPGKVFPRVIAGPCSAETQVQVVETARELARLPSVAAFRCGLWKPRTRPGDFEGVGDAGLEWLQIAKEETGLKTAVEVALPGHVEVCLQAGVDILWIGSRTVVNPFSVSEIAEALKGTDMPVLVKNPVNPDLGLWIGALERMYHQGIRKLAAVHRGFSAFSSHPYRNLPLWEIPAELRRQWPQLPILTDPSHIAGNRDLIPKIMEASAGMAFDGFMIESHIQPEAALTDRDQQLTPSSLGEILQGMTAEEAGKSMAAQLELLRMEIDRTDDEILRLISFRMDTAVAIGELKKSLGMDVLQKDRWREVVEDRLQKGEGMGLSREFLLNLLEEIHREALKKQGRDDRKS
jgi:chorismate mutase